MSAATAATWRVLGASVVGTSHSKLGRGCEDDNGAARLADGTIVVVVADGAGSAPRSAEGSACAVEAGVARAAALLEGAAHPDSEEGWQATLSDVLADIRAAIERLAEGAEADAPRAELRSFATTVLGAVVTEAWLAAAQIGDGGVVAREADGRFTLVLKPQHGEHINETFFVTQDDYLRRAEFVARPVDEVTGLALFTDGLEQLALQMPGYRPYAPFFTSLFEFADDPEADTDGVEEFLTSERVCARTDDDKTLVLAVRR